MADFEIIEADFQQYYHLDVSTLGFQRYARLLTNLPAESRFVRKYSPFRDWSWEKEMQAQILLAVDTIATMYANAHRKRGQKALEVPELVQPDYVAKAKKDAKRQKRDNQAATLDELKAFFEKRNNAVTKLEKVSHGNQDLLDRARDVNAVSGNLENRAGSDDAEAGAD